jgi:hypothetical protein
LAIFAATSSAISIPARPAGFRRAAWSGIVSLFIGVQPMPAAAAPVPFNCVVLPGGDAASIRVTNSLGSDASCIVTCTFSTTASGNYPQISCAKPVPAGKEVEMCQLTSPGDKMVKLTAGQAECTR